MTEGNSLINLGDLAKPINTLVEKISDAIGVLYEPLRIIRKAKADAKSQEIMTLSDISAKEIQQRALSRFVHEETKKQENIESIIENTIPHINPNAQADKLDNDWLVMFFENAKLVSDTEMQLLWSKILAGETNAPGTFPKRTLNLISDIDRRDAELFTNICKFTFYYDHNMSIIFDIEDKIYKNYGLNFSSLVHLDNIGLLTFNHLSGYARTKLSKETIIHYYGKPIKITFPNEENNILGIGTVLLSQVGVQLASICGSSPEKEIIEYTIEKWRSKGLLVERL